MNKKYSKNIYIGFIWNFLNIIIYVKVYCFLLLFIEALASPKKFCDVVMEFPDTVNVGFDGKKIP